MASNTKPCSDCIAGKVRDNFWEPGDLGDGWFVCPTCNGTGIVPADKPKSRLLAGGGLVGRKPSQPDGIPLDDYIADRKHEDPTFAGRLEEARKEVEAEIASDRPSQPDPGNEYINVVFDGPPGPVAGRFIEVETDDGHSINAGEWIQRDGGKWALRINLADREAYARQEVVKALLKIEEKASAYSEKHDHDWSCWVWAVNDTIKAYKDGSRG